ncbi:hypothetical protein LTS17_007794 [Exophiala oligosperma]
MNLIKVGIIGYGFSTKCFHLPFILALPDRFKVTAFFQRSEAPGDPRSAKRGTHCTVDHPEAKHYRTADEFFADPDVQVVIVCSKTDTHAEYAEKALLAGKHGTTRPSPFPSFFSSGILLHDSDFLTLQHLIQNDALGDVKEVEIHYDVDFPFWMRNMNKKVYTPGDGMMFGLEQQIFDSLSPQDPRFGVEPTGLNGTLTTSYCFDDGSQNLDSASKKYVGRYPTLRGHWLGFYENLADAIQKETKIAVEPGQSRDGIRTIELGRMSHAQGRGVPWA